MSSPFVISHLRTTKLVTAALALGLVGGTLAIDTVASRLSSEIGRTDRSAPGPAPHQSASRIIPDLLANPDADDLSPTGRN